MFRLRVRELAEEKNLSMYQLSLKSEVSYHIIREVFSNPLKILRTDTINRIARTLDVPVTDLIAESPDERKGD